MNKKKLTLQQAKFVEAMAHPQTKSQTQAAIAAGCPPKTARITASKWLTKANIIEAIETRKSRAIANAGITPEEVLGSAVSQMRSSINDVLDESGSFSLEKARASNAIDFVKKHKETTKTFTNKDGAVTTVKTIEIEMLSNQDGRREVANYILDKKTH